MRGSISVVNKRDAQVLVVCFLAAHAATACSPQRQLGDDDVNKSIMSRERGATLERMTSAVATGLVPVDLTFGN